MPSPPGQSGRLKAAKSADNLLFRRFVGPSMDAPAWDGASFPKSRGRLLAAEITRKLPAAMLAQPRVTALVPGKEFSAGGTLTQAWASHTSFRPKDTPSLSKREGRAGQPRRKTPFTLSICLSLQAMALSSRASIPRIRCGQRRSITLTPR